MNGRYCIVGHFYVTTSGGWKSHKGRMDKLHSSLNTTCDQNDVTSRNLSVFKIVKNVLLDVAKNTEDEITSIEGLEFDWTCLVAELPTQLKVDL